MQYTTHLSQLHQETQTFIDHVLLDLARLQPYVSLAEWPTSGNPWGLEHMGAIPSAQRGLKGVMQLIGDEVWLWYDARPKGLSLSWAFSATLSAWLVFDMPIYILFLFSYVLSLRLLVFGIPVAVLPHIIGSVFSN